MAGARGRGVGAFNQWEAEVACFGVSALLLTVVVRRQYLKARLIRLPGDTLMFQTHSTLATYGSG